MMGKRAGKALATHFLGCCPCIYLCTRKLKKQHSALELVRAVSSQQLFWWSVRDFQGKRAECDQEEVADAFPRVVVSEITRRWI